ncbi:type I-E CRISPR-associated protein Cas6/Cse3/CasE [Dethiosulfovibrio sp. F2B]|uniref:type I-E CRISPR-associated protein Cas6/Cse3/CasE n=1 Tax=Dethiosulfovibrio faecalis TaxID=2720018 RepID=UPI001F21728D|nr:type I-E CRISPR-associated protein Cas6/Cse3/CasE [Dethiosulfovibrio faecalis]MCF4152273.1 type I-E CRISPR-associated protein Cas6/Cse3/CasE [Dethiosulfovibrio faecalis]
MYLSEWRLPWSRSHNPYEIHRKLWEAFPDMPDGKRSFLFRWEKQFRSISVLMLSQNEPRKFQGATFHRSSVFDPRIDEGPYIFTVRANPVKRLAEARCRVPLVGEQALVEWLNRKMEGICEIEDVTVQSRSEIYFKKRDMAGKIVTVDYRGILRPKNGEALLSLMKKGLGPAKAFGCGMLLLKRL